MSENQDDITARIRDWTNENAIEASKTPDEVLQDRIKQSYSDMIAAKSTLASAPNNYEVAREAYLRLKNGDDGYDELVSRRGLMETKKEAVTYAQQLRRKYEKVKRDIALYKSVVSFVSDAERDYLDTIKASLKKLKEKQASVQFNSTSQRKTYYLNVEQETVDTWNNILSVLLVAIGIVFLKVKIVDPRQFKSLVWWAVVLGFWLASFFIPLAVSWYMHLSKPVNIYNSWADTNTPEWHGQTFQH